MTDKKQLILFLVTRDPQYLPEGYPKVDLKKWLKKTDLQRFREIKRITSSIIEGLKESPTEQTTYLFNFSSKIGTWCPPNCE